MADSLSVTAEIDSFVKEADDDYVGLWQIVSRVKRKATDGGDIQTLTLAVIGGLLDRGLQAGNLTKDGGFQLWSQQDAKAVKGRIQREWHELGRDPTIDDIAWFQPRR